MGIFKKLFAAKKKDSGPIPTRDLMLQFSIKAENGGAFANQFKDMIKKKQSIDLEYTIDSLTFVDNFLQKFKDDGTTVDEFAEVIFVAGCYVGQTIIMNCESEWVDRDEANLPENIGMSSMLVRAPNGAICDPVGKTFKRFYYGESESVVYLYHVFAAEALK